MKAPIRTYTGSVFRSAGARELNPAGKDWGKRRGKRAILLNDGMEKRIGEEMRKSVGDE